MAIQGLEFEKPTLVDGGHEQKAIVNTASGKQPVNAPTVEDIKRIAKGEAEESSATEWEKDLKPLVYWDKANERLIMFNENNTGLVIDGSYVEGYFEGNLVFEIGLEEQYLEFKSDYGYIGYDYPLQHVWTEAILDGNSNEIDTNDLERGNRIYRHSVLLTKSSDNIKFKFVVYNSSPDEFDNFGDYLDNDRLEGVAGLIYDIANDLKYIGIISVVAGTMDVIYNGTVITFSDTTTTISDSVEQC